MSQLLMTTRLALAIACAAHLSIAFCFARFNLIEIFNLISGVMRIRPRCTPIGGQSSSSVRTIFVQRSTVPAMQPSRRESSPRRCKNPASCSAPASMVGSHSKTTSLSPEPIRTSEPATAPFLKSAFSTPSCAKSICQDNQLLPHS